MNHPYSLGWSPDLFARHRGRIGYSATPIFGDDRPIPPALSLSAYRLRHLEQGGAGTCWVHCAVQAFEILTGACGEYVQSPLSRMLVAYQGTVIMAGDRGVRGNPADGGFVSAAFEAMGERPKGLGVCHDAIWPYSDRRSDLAKTPPIEAIRDADPNRVHQVSSIPSWGEPIQRAILNGHPVGIGIWWPYGWDTEGQTVFDSIGIGVYGHAITIIGWRILSGQLQWQLDNWHGLLYSPLPMNERNSIPGYKPIREDRTSDFWVTDAALRRVLGKGNTELVTVAGASGFQRRELSITEGLMDVWKDF